MPGFQSFINNISLGYFGVFYTTVVICIVHPDIVHNKPKVNQLLHIFSNFIAL